MELPNFEPNDFDKYKNTTMVDSLAVTLYPLTAGEEIQKYFGANLLEDGILPVYFFAENRDDSASFVFQKEKFYLGTQEDFQALNVQQVQSSKEAMGSSLIALGGLVTVFGGIKLVSDAKVVRHNIQKKQLHLKTLSPGKKMEGFLFFKIPEKQNESQFWTIHFKPLNLQTHNLLEMSIDFQWTKNPT